MLYLIERRVGGTWQLIAGGRTGEKIALKKGERVWFCEFVAY